MNPSLVDVLLHTVDTKFKHSMVIDWWLDGSISGELTKTIIEKTGRQLAD